MTLQSKEDNVKRPYRSPRREAQADATKRAIIEAALQLFTANGFRSTTIKQVAEAAAVSEQTVYNAFGDKVGLLHASSLHALGPEEQPEIDAFLETLRSEPDATARIRMVARFSREQWQEGALEVDRLFANTDTSDARMAELADQVLEYKLDLNRSIAEILFPDPIRRPDVTVEEIAVFSTAVDSGPTITMLQKLGWSMAQYEDWVVRLLSSFLRTPD